APLHDRDSTGDGPSRHGSLVGASTHAPGSPAHRIAMSSILDPVKPLLRPAVRWLRTVYRRLHPEPRYERIGNLAELGAQQPWVRFDRRRIVAEGWLTSREENALYSLGRWTRGPILEIGPWLGRSTTILALGIADAGQEKEFVTREI